MGLTYFSKFPTIQYEGRTCVDITRRVVIRKTVTSDPKAYRPYEVPAGQRTDQIAAGYYGTPDKEWLVLLSTMALDPYYDWYLSDRDFAQHLISKYGSIENTVRRIHHWSVNWYGTDVELSLTQHASLPDELRQYYEPVFGRGSDVISYARREDDLYASTNMIVTVTVGDHPYHQGDVVDLIAPDLSVGTAEVVWTDSTRLKLIHVQGETDPGARVDSLTITATEYTSNVIPIDERPFWEPVSVFEFERDRNESAKDVKLVDNRFADRIETELERILKA